jgi:hypothetical protein
MPLSIGPSVPKGNMPPDLEAAAASSDAMIGDQLSGLIPPPDRPFNPKVVSALAVALAKVMGVMGVEMTPEPYSGPVDALPPDEARYLAMIEAAAADYGNPMPVALSEIKGDSELTVLSAFLNELASDPKFEAYLNEDMGEEEDMGEDEGVAPSVEVNVETGGEDEGEDMPKAKGKGKGKGGDDFFAGRMRS